MNSVTGNERRMLETAFRDLLEFYYIKFTNFEILPNEYVYQDETEQTTPLT
jgi:hypothetical protein